MGETLKQYGGLIVAVLVASFLLFFFGYAEDSCSDALDDSVFSKTSYNQNYEDIKDIVGDNVPNIECCTGYTIDSNDTFDPKEAIVSAYNSESDFDIYILTAEESKSLAEIKNSIKPGKVNVVFPEEYDSKIPGKYELKYYVKNSTSDGLWSYAICTLHICEYSSEEE